MRVRRLGHRAIELEVGPYTFLLSDAVPIAYRDESGYVRSDNRGDIRGDDKPSKLASRHMNHWLKTKGSPKARVVPQADIMALFLSLGDRRMEPTRRSEDGSGQILRQLGEALLKASER
jgi:hypothetical protein